MPLRLLHADPAAHAQPNVRGQRDQMRFWRPFPAARLDVVCGEGDAITGVPLHLHEALQVLLPTSRFVAESGGRPTVVDAGIIHVTDPLELCGARGVDGGGAPFSARVLFVGPALLPRLTAVGDASVGTTHVHDPALYDELLAVFDELRRPLMVSDCESRLVNCLSRVIAAHSARAQSRPVRCPTRVLRARDYLREHTTRSVTLDALAGACGLSKFYLLRAFDRTYGLTPHAYHMQLRLARARRWLAECRPIGHVTYDAGFADQSHLTRRFADFYGMTPARFARQLARPLAERRKRERVQNRGSERRSFPSLDRVTTLAR